MLLCAIYDSYLTSLWFLGVVVKAELCGMLVTRWGDSLGSPVAYLHPFSCDLFCFTYCGWSFNRWARPQKIVRMDTNIKLTFRCINLVSLNQWVWSLWYLSFEVEMVTFGIVGGSGFGNPALLAIMGFLVYRHILVRLNF